MKNFISTIKYTSLVLLLTMAVQAAQAQTVSDNELKKNISPITNPSTALMALEPKMFEYNTKEFSQLKLPTGQQYGFMSENFEQVFPSLVEKKYHSFMKGKNNYQKAATSTIELEGLIPVMVACIQEQQTMIDQLKKELEELKKKK